MRYFITAIGTNSGKTLVSAILTEMLNADYWKPVQAGEPRDAEIVKSLISNPISKIHPETYLLTKPMSPHAAAKMDGITINLGQLVIPIVTRDLVIEGAGGALVPLNDHDVVIDMVPLFDAQVILVADLYLGSINHTLLTVEALRHRNLPLKGIIFYGPSNMESQKIILKKTGLRELLYIPREEMINKQTIKKYAYLLQMQWNELE